MIRSHFKAEASTDPFYKTPTTLDEAMQFIAVLRERLDLLDEFLCCDRTDDAVRLLRAENDELRATLIRFQEMGAEKNEIIDQITETAKIAEMEF
jgi:hypothetical protein